MRKTVLVFLAIVVVASGCTQTSENNSPGTQPTEAPDGEIGNSSSHTITFTGSGFQPSDLTIEQGDTVVWESDSSRSMWIASDRHPSHTNYAGTTLQEHCQNGDQTEAAFDQCSTGERFSFTFEKTGEWSYHNHQPFISGGTITVR